MAAGDFVVRRNNANTDALPDTDTGTLDLLWDTSVDSEGTGITYSSGTFTLGETGRFLVMASDQYGTTDTTNNERVSTHQQFVLAGTLLDEGACAGYIRRASGSQEYITQSIAYVNVTTTTGNGDELIVRQTRLDNSTAGTVNRIADRSGVSIIKLDDDWNYAHYRSTSAFTPSSTDNTRNQSQIGTTVEEDGTVFSRSGNQVTVDTSNPVLVILTHIRDLTDAASGRSEYQQSIDWDGAELVRGVGQTYGPRATDEADAAAMSTATIVYPDDTGQILEGNLISREDADEDWFCELQLIELPSGAATATVERTTAAGNHNANGADFAWQAAVSVHADFAYTAGNANIDCDNADDYIAIANVGNFTDAGHSGIRAVPAQSFRVDSVEQSHIGASSYNRSTGTADHAHEFIAGLVTTDAANEPVTVYSNRIGTTSTTQTAVGGFSLIRLSTLFDSATTHEGTGSGSLAVTSANETGVRIRHTGASGSIVASTANVTGQRTAIETASGSLTLTAANAVTQRKTFGTGSGSLVVSSANETGVRIRHTTASGSLVLSGTGTGEKSTSATGTGTGSLALTTSNVGTQRTAIETASGSVALTAGNAGTQRQTFGQATGSLALTAANGVANKTGKATGSTSVALTTSGAATQRKTFGTGVAALGVTTWSQAFRIALGAGTGSLVLSAANVIGADRDTLGTVEGGTGTTSQSGTMVTDRQTSSVDTDSQESATATTRQETETVLSGQSSSTSISGANS